MKELFFNKATKTFMSLAFVLCILLSNFSIFADKEKFDSWQAVAIRMAEVFDEAIENTKNDELKLAYENVNDAYFGYYEVQGFEKNVMTYISSKRVNHIEWLFSDVKHTLLGNQDGSKDEIIQKIESLKVKVYRDALVLDGVLGKSSPDYEGEAIYGESEVPERWISDEEAVQLAERGDDVKASDKNNDAKLKAGEEKSAKPEIKTVDPSVKNKKTFIITFSLLLREGLEAILVIVAIIAYLVKTGNDHMKKDVYLGCLAGVVASIILALILDFAIENSGVAQELIEGLTMFLAVAILFYVSHWMLSKADNKKWSEYIQGKVSDSIDKKNKFTLVFAAFLAVLREGAELILFYKAAFMNGMDSKAHIVYGILAGTVVLVVIYIIFRYTSVKLPLKPFFLFMSVLLFLMCISFMGKGVVELTEANVISGRTIIPIMNGYQNTWLNIYDRAETLVPQLMLTIASLWLIIKHMFGGKEQ